jgi:catechol 2,3-dioxygenase-like lactoylglutathione lyase family enzyme
VPTLEQLEIADEPDDWSAVGFDVEGDVCRVSSVLVQLVGKGPRRGILGWTLGNGAPNPVAPAAHPNGVIRIDHVVLMSPDLDRTVDDLRADGFELRRIREGETPGGSTRQAFFRVGEPILEVVQPRRARASPAIPTPPRGSGGSRSWSRTSSRPPPRSAIWSARRVTPFSRVAGSQR